MKPVALIDRRRRQLKLSKAALCAAAGVDYSSYLRAMDGRDMRPATVAKLNLALVRASKKFGAAAADLAPLAAYRLAVVLAAQFYGADPKAALDADPARRATADKAWATAAAVRRLAFYVCNTTLGFEQASLARAAGLTRQAVSDAIPFFEEDRDRNPALERWLNSLEGALS